MAKKKKPKHNGGRRGLYHEYLTEDGLTKLTGWAKDGLVDEQIANNIGIARGTLYEWKRKYPAIDDALKKGKEVVDFEVENALFKRALGYEYQETKVIRETINGVEHVREEVTQKHMPSDSTSMIFWLKNRQPDKWQKVASDIHRQREANITKTEAETELARAEIERSDDTQTVEVMFVDDLKDVIVDDNVDE